MKKCQIFTPPKIVEVLLNEAGYHQNLYGKKILENSCGDGNILKEIVKRYIENCIDNKLSISEIKLGLENDIYGIEIDSHHAETCVHNLNNIANVYSIRGVNWNINKTDFLTNRLDFLFDFIIGNPPYINYRELTIEVREYIRDEFASCECGKFDYCYPFIEGSINCLKEGGILVYLIPNSIFKNVFASKLRTIILSHLKKIIDYTSERLFENAITSSAIIVCKKENNSDYFEYVDIVKNSSFNVTKKHLKDKWVFKEKSSSKSKNRFGDFYNASISIATLFNFAYVLRDYEMIEDYVVVGDFRIEKKLVREAVSPRSLRLNRKELIIFPYMYSKGKLVRYEQNIFEEFFPEAVRYLKSHEKNLCARKSDNNTRWFEYGRTQAIAHMNKTKILLSTVITNQVNTYKIDESVIPYSGIYIISKNKYESLENAQKILESKRFFEYIKDIGINASGNSIRITSNDINNYIF